MYNWDFTVLSPYVYPLFEGLFTTVWISLLSIVIGTIGGVLLAVCRNSKIMILKYPSIVFIELFLALPVLVLLIWVYYCLPLIYISFSATITAIIAFSLSLSAFVAETIRSGINSIPEGQIDAAHVLHLSRIQIYRYIIFPQVFTLMLPALLTQYVTCFKLSTLASIIAVYELLHTANNIALQTYRPLEVYSLVALMFILVIIPINVLVRKVEGKLARRGHA